MRWYMINYQVDWINLEVRCIQENGYKNWKGRLEGCAAQGLKCQTKEFRLPLQ